MRMEKTVGCKRCGESVDPKAKACPQCGVTNPGVKLKDLVLGFVALGVLGWLALTVLGWMFGAGSEQATAGKQSSDQPATSAPLAEVPDVPQDEHVSTLGIAPQEFVDRLNANLQKADLPYRGRVKIENGVMQSMLSDRHALIANVDLDSGQLREVLVIASGDGTFKSGADVLLVGVAAMAAAIPDARMDDGLGNLVADMVSEAIDSGNSVKRVRSDTEISVTKSDQIGLMFSASPVE